jgi:integrase
MLCVAYETLARRGELVALQIRDLDFHPDGTGQAIIRRGKTDAVRQGRVANPGSIAPIFKRVAQWIGMPARVVSRVSGHSTRVGATQELAALDIDLGAITQAGGWKSTRMPLQYAEKINAARSGMARAAAASGRDETVSANLYYSKSTPGRETQWRSRY